MTIFHLIKWPAPTWPIATELDDMPAELRQAILDECEQIWQDWVDNRVKGDTGNDLRDKYTEIYIRRVSEYEG